MYFEIYEEGGNASSSGGKGSWRWRLKGGNHEIMAQGEDYVAKAECEAAVDRLKSTTAETPVKYL